MVTHHRARHHGATPAAPASSGSATSPPEPRDGDPGKPNERYGGFQLKFGDHDPLGDISAVYGGLRRKTIFAASRDAVCAPGRRSGTSVACTDRMVEFLRDDLRALGFRAFPPKPARVARGTVNPESLFDWQTEWAVREFQIAAAMPNVAVEDPNKKPSKEEERKQGRYLSRLKAKTNDKKLKEHPSGEVTPETAKTIKHWLDNHYRCPVVIQATQTVTVLGPKERGKKRKKSRERQIVSENVWRWDEIPHSAPEMRAWDLSGYYPAGHSYEDIPVGNFTFWQAYNGPVSKPGKHQCWPEAELGPQGLLGKTWETMSDAEKSTLRAICAVGEQECLGYLDAVNFYDNCHGSMGPCHWTMPKENTKKVAGGHPKKVPSGGELCGFMAFLEAKYPTAFAKHFAGFGIWGPRWGKAPPGAGSHGRPWIGTPETPGGFVYLCGADKEFIEVPTTQIAGRGFAETYWLRSWPWVYRMEMATRTDPTIRKAMWDYAARRITKIGAMTAVGDWVPKIVNSDGTEHKARLADVLTSEQGIAVALRIHVRGSGLLTCPTGKKAVLRNALKVVLKTDLFREKDASGNPGKLLRPTDWGTPHEVALVDALIAAARQLGDVGGTSQAARDWPTRPPTRQERKAHKEKGCHPHSWYPDPDDLSEVALDSERNSFMPLEEA